MGKKAIQATTLEKQLTTHLTNTFKQSDYSYRSLSKETGISVGRLQKIFSESAPLYIGELDKLGKAFRLTPWQLLKDLDT